MSGEAPAVAEGRGRDPRAQFGAQGRQPREVASQRDGDLHVVVEVASNGFGEPDGGQVREAVAAGESLAGHVTTGTPIHRASQVVSPPLYGMVSTAISTSL